MNSGSEILESALFERLAGQMHAARRAYKEAAANYTSVNAKYGDMLDVPDGTAALLKAAQSEARASQDYEAAVKAWGAFLQRHCLSVLPDTEL